MCNVCWDYSAPSACVWWYGSIYQLACKGNWKILWNDKQGVSLELKSEWIWKSAASCLIFNTTVVWCPVIESTLSKEYLEILYRTADKSWRLDQISRTSAASFTQNINWQWNERAKREQEHYNSRNVLLVQGFFCFFAEFEFNMLHIDKVFRKVFFVWIIVIFLFKSFKAAVIVSFSIQTIILHGLREKKLCGAEETVTPYDIFHVTLYHLTTKTLISAALKVCFLHKQVPEYWPEFSFLFL